MTEKPDERDALIESLRSQVEALTIDLKLLELELALLRRQKPRPEELR